MYGTGTRSYNRSTEARQNKIAQKAATEAWLNAPKKTVLVGPICTCRSFNLPHELKRHKELKTDFDWRLESERHVVYGTKPTS